jgi:hypothetical protein
MREWREERRIMNIACLPIPVAIETARASLTNSECRSVQLFDYSFGFMKSINI